MKKYMVVCICLLSHQVVCGMEPQTAVPPANYDSNVMPQNQGIAYNSADQRMQQQSMQQNPQMLQDPQMQQNMQMQQMPQNSQMQQNMQMQQMQPGQPTVSKEVSDQRKRQMIQNMLKDLLKKHRSKQQQNGGVDGSQGNKAGSTTGGNGVKGISNNVGKSKNNRPLTAKEKAEINKIMSKLALVKDPSYLQKLNKQIDGFLKSQKNNKKSRSKSRRGRSHRKPVTWTKLAPNSVISRNYNNNYYTVKPVTSYNASVYTPVPKLYSSYKQGRGTVPQNVTYPVRTVGSNQVGTMSNVPVTSSAVSVVPNASVVQGTRSTANSPYFNGNCGCGNANCNCMGHQHNNEIVIRSHL